MTNTERMTQLALTFPTLRKAPGVDPWDISLFEDWAKMCSHGELLTVRFLLAVWHGRSFRVESTTTKADGTRIYKVSSPWSCGLFDAVDALGTWDREHREAFLTWAKEPWWP